MTTITIERSVLEQALEVINANTVGAEEIEDALRAALVAPATAPSWHDAPEGRGMWVVRDSRGWGIINVASQIGDGWKKPDTRYFGPLPGDKP